MAIFSEVFDESKLTALLDARLEDVLKGQVAQAIESLATSLASLRDECRSNGQLGSFKKVCHEHRLHSVLLEDPYTHRAYHKPRGYAGDAVMLDYIYSAVPPSGTSSVGRDIFNVTTRSSPAMSIVWRRQFFAGAIDRAAAKKPRPRILTVGCGHLREAQLSVAMQERQTGEFVAIDQDEKSLGVVEKEQGANGVRTLRGSVLEIISRRLALGNFDLIYCAGLYDYLTDKVACRFARSLCSMLEQGGELIIANYAPDSQGRGYMEGFMDWDLVYRDELQTELLASEVDGDTVSSQEAFRDLYGNVVFKCWCKR